MTVLTLTQRHTFLFHVIKSDIRSVSLYTPITFKKISWCEIYWQMFKASQYAWDLLLWVKYHFIIVYYHFTFLYIVNSFEQKRNSLHMQFCSSGIAFFLCAFNIQLWGLLPWGLIQTHIFKINIIYTREQNCLYHKSVSYVRHCKRKWEQWCACTVHKHTHTTHQILMQKWNNNLIHKIQIR